jgi:hypothetical protein
MLARSSTRRSRWNKVRPRRGPAQAPHDLFARYSQTTRRGKRTAYTRSCPRSRRRSGRPSLVKASRGSRITTCPIVYYSFPNSACREFHRARMSRPRSRRRSGTPEPRTACEPRARGWPIEAAACTRITERLTFRTELFSERRAMFREGAFMNGQRQPSHPAGAPGCGSAHAGRPPIANLRIATT